MKNELTDDDLMWFGTHRDKRLMDVPVNYLHWLYHDNGFNDQHPVVRYCHANIEALEMENTDLVWIRRPGLKEKHEH